MKKSRASLLLIVLPLFLMGQNWPEHSMFEDTHYQLASLVHGDID